MENTTIYEAKLKCHVIIVIKTDLSGFVVTMHSGFCEHYVKPLGLSASGFDFTLCIVTTTPSITGLNPLNNKARICLIFIWSQNEVSHNTIDGNYYVVLTETIRSIEDFTFSWWSQAPPCWEIKCYASIVAPHRWKKNRCHRDRCPICNQICHSYRHIFRMCASEHLADLQPRPWSFHFHWPIGNHWHHQWYHRCTVQSRPCQLHLKKKKKIFLYLLYIKNTLSIFSPTISTQILHMYDFFIDLFLTFSWYFEKN